MLRNRTRVLILFLGLATPVAAGSLEDGKAALAHGDFATAMQLWRPLADHGVAEAQFGLGVLYAKGDGVPQDYAAAVGWYRKAADQGFTFAQFSLGFMYATGRGVPQDYVRAYMWTNLAAARGVSDAIESLNIIASKMSPAQIAEAQKLASEWKPKPS
jgi:uncharacterized protein